jgi:predicted nucleic acid-binding Zn ribbon protein
MAMESIDQIIHIITQEPAWDSYHAWKEILAAWPLVINTILIPQRPTQDIYPRSRVEDTLYIATINASLADHCNWQRRQILKSLNNHLTTPLTEIRFSSSRWQLRSPPTETLDSLGDRSLERCVCPKCDACTPRWELDRWLECRFCVAKHWR